MLLKNYYYYNFFSLNDKLNFSGNKFLNIGKLNFYHTTFQIKINNFALKKKIIAYEFLNKYLQKRDICQILAHALVKS